MSYQIRPAILQDADQLQRLNQEELGYTYELATTARQLAKLLTSTSDIMFVAEVQGDVVGYVHASDYELLYSDPLKNIMGIAVDHRYRQQGIGRGLLAAVEAWARKEGCEGVRLASGAQRHSAHTFYEHCGYTGGKQQLNYKKLW